MRKPEEEIRALIDERIAALRAKDAAKAIECLADNVVAFELAPPLSIDSSAARDIGNFAAWLDGFEELDIEVAQMQIEAQASVGFAHALHHLTGRRPGGRAISLWMRSTLCFRRESQGWKIAHAHTSVPFHMDGSFRAAVDLQPS